MTIQLVHLSSSSLAGRKHDFSQNVVKLGRRPDNDVAFDPHQDRTVSGYHAELHISGETVTVKDLATNNGTWVNGVRMSAPVTVSSGDIIRLGEQGPEIRITVGTATAARQEGVPPVSSQKEGIGKATLERAINTATSKERSKSRAVYMVLLILVVVLAAGGAFIFLQSEKKAEEERARLEAETQAAKKKTEEISMAMEKVQENAEKALADSMNRYETELNALKGKIGAGESRIARLIVEIQERDNALEAIKKRQDLSEEQRKKLLAETEAKLKGLKNDLAANEKNMREAAKKAADNAGPQWADLVDQYKESLFLCYVESAPDAEGRVRSGTGTAFCVRSNGLLATNAHVAAMFLDNTFTVKLVIQNHTGKVFKVKRAKNHPNYSNPASPDVALVEVETDGNSFPAMPLASKEDLKNLRIGTQLGTMGYPGELSGIYLSSIDKKTQTVKSALATFKDGWIGRITDFNRARADFSSSYFIQHSASLSGGTSGSPMFNAEGKVVALNNSGMDLMVTVDRNGNSGTQRTPSAAEIGNAIRVDLLQDLMRQTNW